MQTWKYEILGCVWAVDMAIRYQERKECEQNVLNLTEALQMKVDRYKILKKFYITFFINEFIV